MNYVGIDYHKAYSVLATVNERGQLLQEARIPGNSPTAFAQYFQSLKGPAKVVLEGCRNWGYLYDLLHEVQPIQEVQLANAYKVRVIAEAQVKTDKIDARALANLLRGDLIPRLHVPSPRNRCRKNVLRQRVFWIRQRTMIRNRVHILVDRQRGVRVPVCRDLFGKQGMDWPETLALGRTGRDAAAPETGEGKETSGPAWTRRGTVIWAPAQRPMVWCPQLAAVGTTTAPTPIVRDCLAFAPGEPAL